MQRLRQLTFASLECDRKTRCEILLERMEASIAPECPKGGRKGRQPHPLSVMLRVHCVQPFCNLSDQAMEDRLARRRASGALPGRCLRRSRTRRRSRLPPPAGAPRTGAPAVRDIRDHLAERRVLLKEGSIISAPSGRLLHGEEEQVRGDSGYRGIGKRAERAHREVSRQIAPTPGKHRTARLLWRRRQDPGAGGTSVPDCERVFGCDMVRYRGLERNVQRLALLLGFSNLMIARPHLS